MKQMSAAIYLTVAVLIGFILGIAWMSIGNEALDGEYLRALKTVGGSGVNWIDAIFRYCVVLLVNVAKVLGISYEALNIWVFVICLLYTSPSPRDRTRSRMPSSA